jgi:hypothetical protein
MFWTTVFGVYLIIVSVLRTVYNVELPALSLIFRQPNFSRRLPGATSAAPFHCPEHFPEKWTPVFRRKCDH